MKPQGRNLFLILFGVPLLIAAPLVFLGAQVMREGMMEVHIVDRSGPAETFDLRLPAALVPAAAGIVRTCGVTCDDRRIDPEAREVLHAAAGILDALRNGPDGVLVQVRSRDEIVHVEKRGSMLEVHVDSPDELVHVKLPLGAARSALAIL